MIDPDLFGPWVSDEAATTFKKLLEDVPQSAELPDLRRHYGELNARMLDDALSQHPVLITQEERGTVPVHLVEPASGPKDARRLLCLHGGAFMWGTGAGALLEAVPIAATTGMQVLAADYRLAPEHVFPAAVDDALAVYESMLDQQDAAAIGVYGCSAGAILTTQLVARLVTEGLPLPGAIAMLHGAGLDFAGDARQISQAFERADAAGPPPTFDDLPYFSEANSNDPLAIPGNHPSVLAQFPPSLLVTSSRDFAASAVWVMHRRLLAAGVDAQCITFDGLWHAHHMVTSLPESGETFAALARFFDAHLHAA